MDDDLADTVIVARSGRALHAGSPERPGPPEGEAVSDDTVVRASALVEPVVRSSRPVRAVASTAPEVEIAVPTPTATAHRFRVNGAEPLATDVPTLIGRAPRARRISGGSPARLVTVESPSREVSSTHLEVRQQGRSVVVTDLRSTNGTVVTVPGADRLALRSGESFVAGPGSFIEIGDGNIIEILPVERLVPGGARDGVAR